MRCEGDKPTISWHLQRHFGDQRLYSLRCRTKLGMKNPVLSFFFGVDKSSFTNHIQFLSCSFALRNQQSKRASMSCFRSCATFISSSDIDQQVHLEQLHWTKKGFKKAVPSTPIRIELCWHESWRYTMWLYLDIFFVCSPGIQAVPVMRSAWVVQPCTDQSGSTGDFHEVESSLIFSKLIKNDPTVLGISDGEKILASNKKIAGDINLLQYYAMLSKQSCVFSFVQQACDVRTKEVSLDDRPVYLQSYVTCSYSSNLNSSSKPSKWQTSFWDATRMYWAVGNLAVTLLLKSSFGWALPRHKHSIQKMSLKKQMPLRREPNNLGLKKSNEPWQEVICKWIHQSESCKLIQYMEVWTIGCKFHHVLWFLHHPTSGLKLLSSC